MITSRPIIIMGMRRSGTSLMWKLVRMMDGIVPKRIMFEPHELWFALRMRQIKRYRNTIHVTTPIDRFVAMEGPKGLKYVFNPEVDALGWPLFDALDPVYVFMIRNWDDTYNSYNNQDFNSWRGVVPPNIHEYFHTRLNTDWTTRATSMPEQAIVMHYETLIRDSVAATQHVAKFLGTAIRPEKVLGLVHDHPEHTAGMQ